MCVQAPIMNSVDRHIVSTTGHVVGQYIFPDNFQNMYRGRSGLDSGTVFFKTLSKICCLVHQVYHWACCESDLSHNFQNMQPDVRCTIGQVLNHYLFITISRKCSLVYQVYYWGGVLMGKQWISTCSQLLQYVLVNLYHWKQWINTFSRRFDIICLHCRYVCLDCCFQSPQPRNKSEGILCLYLPRAS